MKNDALRIAEQSGVLAGYEGEPDKLEKFVEIVRAEERARICRILYIHSAEAPELVRIIKEKV